MLMTIARNSSSEIKESSKGNFFLRLGAEVGRAEFYAAYKAEHGRAPSREEQDEHTRWTSLFLFHPSREPLERLNEKLRRGKSRSRFIRINGNPQRFTAQARDEGGNVVASQEDYISTNLSFVDAYDRDISRFVPILAELK